MRIIDDELLDGLTAEAEQNPRLRKNYNFHQNYDEPCQRLLNAVEPGSYLRPHRHLFPPKPECFILLRGQVAIVTFDDRGEVERVLRLAPGGGSIGADIPAGTWHSVVSLEAGSVFFETKPGPYVPLSDKDWAPWAPAEGSPEVEGYLARLLPIVTPTG